MRVLLVSEGIHERGDLGERGALEILVRRLCPAATDIRTRPVNDPTIKMAGSRGDRFYRRALAWLREAERQGCEALVFLVDRDDDRDRPAQIRKAQECADFLLPRALGVAIRSFDAWMLADTRALSDTLGRTVDTQPDPESMKDPKSRFASLAGGVGVVAPVRELYARIAATADPDELVRRCPDGFAAFAHRVRLLAPPR